MQVHIIHLPHRLDRWITLEKELYHQNITDIKIWHGIVDANIVAKGISQAHKQIVRYAQDQKLPEVLIAEDDLKFTSKGAYDFFISNKPSDYDLYLASIYFGVVKNDNSVDDFSGLTFYMVNERFYQRFLSAPEYDNLDRSLRGTGKFIVCDPFTVIQYDGFSDNLKENTNYYCYLKNKRMFAG